MEEKKEAFEYTYSARQQTEIEEIRRKYIPKEEDKMTLLRKLDREAERPGIVWSILLGVTGCLVLGFGISCILVWKESLFALGIAVGIIGIFLIGMAYPLYVKITKKQREKLAPQILALTEELLK